MHMKSYAIIDSAAESDFFTLLEEFNPPCCCLYAEPITEEWLKLAPYLVELTQDVKQWIESRNSYWGCYLTATANMRELRQHLRKFLHAIIPIEKKPVLFRFYDPRNIKLFCDILTDAQLCYFLGDIQTIATLQQGEEQIYTFAERRINFPPVARTQHKLLTFTQQQYEKLNLAFEQRYINQLANEMAETLPHASKENIADFALQLFNYLQELNITDQNVVHDVALLLAKLGCSQFNEIPEDIISQLASPLTPGLINAKMLLIENQHLC